MSIFPISPIMLLKNGGIDEISSYEKKKLIRYYFSLYFRKKKLSKKIILRKCIFDLSTTRHLLSIWLRQSVSVYFCSRKLNNNDECKYSKCI